MKKARTKTSEIHKLHPFHRHSALTETSSAPRLELQTVMLVWAGDVPRWKSICLDVQHTGFGP